MEAATNVGVGSSAILKINTKGLCLLCLNDGCSTLSDAETSSFKMLLRYLKINTYKLCNFSSSFLESMDALEDTEVVVTLCNECSDTTKIFSKLYQDMEHIRLRLDSCLQILHDAMRRGGSETRVEEYRRRMRSRNMYDMFNASVADQLRNETMKKCSQKVETLIPRVLLPFREKNSLASTSPSSSTQPRRMPGPKSKTCPTSKLKALLTHQDDGSRRLGQNQSILLASLLSGNEKKNGALNKKKKTSNPVNCDTVDELSMNYSEEFVVKVEPHTVDNEMDNFHDENEDSTMHNAFGVAEDVAAISNFDGQLIGHFLGRDNADAKVALKNESHRLEGNASSQSFKKAGGFVCSYCHKTFNSSFSLGGHMHVHKNRKKVGNYKPVDETKVDGVVVKTMKKHALKKKKFKCSICKKMFQSMKSYRAHLKLYHGGENNAGSSKPRVGKIIDCEVCGKRFSQHTVHRTHMVSLHSMHVFSKYLPIGTTEDQLDAAIQEVLAQHKEILDPNKKKGKLYGCQFCAQVYPHPSHLRLHLLRNHFDKVLVMLQNLFNVNQGSIEIANGEGESNEDVRGNASHGLELFFGGDDEGVEEGLEEEIEAQPILLSDVYSLSEGGAGNEGRVEKDDDEFEKGDPLGM